MKKFGSIILPDLNDIWDLSCSAVVLLYICLILNVSYDAQVETISDAPSESKDQRITPAENGLSHTPTPPKPQSLVSHQPQPAGTKTAYLPSLSSSSLHVHSQKDIHAWKDDFE